MDNNMNNQTEKRVRSVVLQCTTAEHFKEYRITVFAVTASASEPAQYEIRTQYGKIGTKLREGRTFHTFGDGSYWSFVRDLLDKKRRKGYQVIQDFNSFNPEPEPQTSLPPPAKRLARPSFQKWLSEQPNGSHRGRYGPLYLA